MGNSNSGLSITLNPPEGSGSGGYVAGSKLSGTVYAQSTEDAGEVGLDLCFAGKEDVKVQYEETVSNGETTSTVTRYSYSKNDIVRMSIPLLGANSSLNAGQYAYPFELQLPEHLPSSMYCGAHDDDGYCSIVYKVKVEAKGKWRNAKEEVDFQVLAKPPSSAPVPNSVEPITSKITTCCCIPKGKITIAANVDDTRVGEGEAMTVNFACKNESSAGIDFAQAKIKQKIHWHSSGHSQKTDEVIAQQNFQLDEGMTKRSTDELRMIKDVNTMGGLQSRGVNDDLYREILATVNEGTNQVSLTIPHQAKHTYRGSLITVYHTLKIKVKTPSCSSNPETKVDLQIVTPNSISGEGNAASSAPTAPPLPNGWDASAVTTSPTISDNGNVVYGGVVTSGETEDDFVVSPFTIPEDLGGPTQPSLQALLKELEMALSARSTIQDKLQDGDWQNIFRNLQPQDVVAVVKAATMEFDQTDVAELIAPAVGNFSCEYVVTLLRSISDWLRIQFVQKLLPLCVDVKTNSNSILNELTEWETISTERDFENALKA